MFKLSYRWMLPLLLVSNAALAAPLLKVVTSSPAIPANSYSNSCTLDSSGQVIIEHTVGLFSTGQMLSSKEIRAVHLNVKDIKAVIADAATGNVTGFPIVGGATHQYFAYQKPVSAPPIFLLDKNTGGLVNDSPLVEPLTKFIDSVCGDISLPQ